MSNKTKLTVSCIKIRHALIPLGRGFEIKRKKIYVMYKNLETPAVECFENGNYHVYRKLFPAKQHFLK